MEYTRLQKLQGHADAAARMERAVECYKERSSKYNSPDLPFEEDVPTLAWSAARFRNNNGFYCPTLKERILDYFASRRALASARSHYANIDFSDPQINDCISGLCTAMITPQIGKTLKRSLPRGFQRRLTNTLKQAIEKSH